MRQPRVNYLRTAVGDIAPGSSSNYVLKVRHGIVLEIGIANKRDTTGRARQTTFLSSNKAV